MVVTIGLIDRTFFWTWDSGTSNHYAKDWRMMTEIVTLELARMGCLQPAKGGAPRKVE